MDPLRSVARNSKKCIFTSVIGFSFFLIRIVLHLLMRIQFVDNKQICHKSTEYIIFLLDTAVGSIFQAIISIEGGHPID